MACHPEAPFTADQIAWLDQRYGQTLVRTPLRVARCGECGLDPAHPVAGVACKKNCPLRHHAQGYAA